MRTVRQWSGGQSYTQHCSNEQRARILDMNVKSSSGESIEEFFGIQQHYVFPQYCSRIGPLKNCAEAMRIGVVGPRKPGSYSVQVTTKCIQSLHLTRSGTGALVWTISGGAVGIDSLVHTVSIKYLVPTCVVVGSGLRHAFRSRQRGFLQSVLDAGGCVVSGFPLLQQATRWTFPLRNKLLVAMSTSITIPELRVGSGTSLTYDEACKQGKHVYCFPRNILPSTTEHSNRAIDTGSAKGISSIDKRKQNVLYLPSNDILQDSNNSKQLQLHKNYDRYEKYHTLLEEECTIDDMIEQLTLPVQEILGALTLMELDGVCRQTTPGRYILC